MGQSELDWTAEPSSNSGGGDCAVPTGYSPTSPAMEINISAMNTSVTASPSSTSTVVSSPMADANGNAMPINGDYQRVHRRSISKDAAQGGHGGTLHWFAVVGDEEEARKLPSSIVDDFPDGDVGQCRPGSASSNSPQQREREREREERLRQCRERQEEDRRRKLEELKQHALAAQKFREQQEEERRRHIEEVRTRETQRRQQVEERKRQIVEADRERKQDIIKRKEERDVRMETRRRHERGQIVFAFGSSTPRMGNDPPSATATATTPTYAVTDSPSNGFWASRKSTSSFNVNVPAGVPSGGPGGATTAASASAGGIRDVMSSSFHQSSSVERPSSASRPVVDDPMTQSMSAIIPGTSPWTSTPSTRARRRTDLTPTVPQSQLMFHKPGNLMETSYHGSTASSHLSSRPSSATASNNKGKPNRAVSLSRLDQLSQPRRGRAPGTPGGPPGPQSAPRPATQRTSSGTDSSEKEKRSMSKSMVHLGPARRTSSIQHALSSRRTSQQQKQLQQAQAQAEKLGAVGSAGDKKASVARSMSHLSGSAPPIVRMTRAERLRMMRARAGGPETNTQATPGAASSSSSAARSGATTPSTPSRPLSALSNASQSQPSSSSMAGGVSGVVRRRHPPGTAAARLKPRPMSIAGTSVEQEKIQKTALQRRDSSGHKAAPSVDRNRATRRSSTGPVTPKKEQNTPSSPSTAVADNMVKAGDTGTIKRAPIKPKPTPKAEKKEEKKEEQPETKEPEQQPPSQQQQQQQQPEQQPAEEATDQQQQQKPKITTEEEAKAAIAERRRLAREQAEREAEEERRMEEEQRMKEEEDQRKWEEEHKMLIETARKAEEERLQKAIEEAAKQAEEEKKRKEEEIKQKAEKEEQEKKAREEAEKQRLEREESLRKEMEEREARRKKVEEIMARTRRGKKDSTDQSGPSSSASSTANSSSNASVSQTSIDSVVAINNNNNINNNSSKEPSLSSNVSSTTLTAPSPAMIDSMMTASMYEEAERNLAEEEAQQRKIWERKEEPKPAAAPVVAVVVNGNGTASEEEEKPKTNGHVESNGFLVDFSSGQSSISDNNGTLISLGIDMNVDNKQQNNPFISVMDHANSPNMASNAIDLL